MTASREPVVDGHRSASFSARKARTSAASTSGAMKARADPARQDEGQLAALDLLVLRDQLHQPVDARRAAGNRPIAGSAGRPPQDGASTRSASAAGRSPRRAENSKRQRHAERDRLAVQQPVGEAGGGLERVPEGVAEIEQRALAGLALVARDDRGLGAAAGGDRVLARRPAGEHVAASSPRARRRRPASPSRPYLATSA